MHPVINLNRCHGCGTCINKCPNNVLVLREIISEEYDKLMLIAKLKVKIKGSFKAHILNESLCTGCKICKHNCHEHAIKVQ